MWLLGPPKLLKQNCEDIEQAEEYPLLDPESDKELRPHVDVFKTNIKEPLSEKFQKFSEWKTLVNAFTLLKRVAKYYKSRSFTNQAAIDPRSVTSYLDTEMFIIKQIQKEFYEEEISCLISKKPIPRNSPLITLDPFLDNGVLRVGGHLNRSNLGVEKRNPVIIPGKCHVAILLVRHFHGSVKHQGRHFTEGAVRSNGFWILGLKRLSLFYHT
jgi:hypothetical protein